MVAVKIVRSGGILDIFLKVEPAGFPVDAILSEREKNVCRFFT